MNEKKQFLIRSNGMILVLLLLILLMHFAYRWLFRSDETNSKFINRPVIAEQSASPPSNHKKVEEALPVYDYVLQLGQFNTRNDADGLVRSLEKENLAIKIIENNQKFTVLVVNITGRERAESLQEKLKEDTGLQSILIKVD